MRQRIVRRDFDQALERRARTGLVAHLVQHQGQPPAGLGQVRAAFHQDLQMRQRSHLPVADQVGQSRVRLDVIGIEFEQAPPSLRRSGLVAELTQSLGQGAPPVGLLGSAIGDRTQVRQGLGRIGRQQLGQG